MLAFTCGLNVRLPRESSDSNAPTGQKRWHHLRNTVSSSTSNAGNTSTSIAGSLNRSGDTGQSRSRTSNQWGIPGKTPGSHTQPPMQGTRPARHGVRRPEIGRAYAFPLAPRWYRSSVQELGEPPAYARIRPSRAPSCPAANRTEAQRGHTQLQNAFPNTSATITTTARQMSTRGTKAQLPNMVSSAPSGQIYAIAS